MLNITYLVYIYNNQASIQRVIDSLKKINGKFRKEFIIIDDGSTDKSLAELRHYTAGMPKTIIITQEHQSPALSINKALSLSHGDYIHFVDGNYTITPDSTMKLYNCCKEIEADVAIGNCSKEALQNDSKATLIPEPLIDILEEKIVFGASNILVSSNLLHEISGCDEEVYNAFLSLALRCASVSKFAYLPEIVAAQVGLTLIPEDKNFEIYDKILTIHNFVQDNQGLAINYLPSILKALLKNTDKLDIKTLIMYLLAKYAKQKFAVKDILALYKTKIEKLF